MVETRTTFTCSFCKLTKSIKLLGNILEETSDLADIEASIEAKTELREQYHEQVLKASDDITKTAFGSNITTLEKELAELYKRANKSKREICSLCVVQGRTRVEVATFTCGICGQAKQGSGLKKHIAGWESKGIYPQTITLVCRNCQDSYAFNPPQDFYCPLTSDGRDDHSLDAHSHSKFDCNCREQDNVLPNRPFRDIF